MTTLALPSIMPTENILSPVLPKIEDLSLSTPRTKKKNLADDSIEAVYSNILDQSKKRLNSLDAQRVVSVVEESAHKCEVVTLLPFIVENLERFSITLGPSLVTALKDYDSLQQLYMFALKNVRQHRPSSAKSSQQIVREEDIELDVAIAKVDSVASSIKESVRTINRLFRSNPVAMNAVKTQRLERSYEANTMIDALMGLREELYNRLVTSASEEQEKLKMSHQILKKEKKAKAQIKKLENDLDKCSKEKRDMVRITIYY